MTQRALGLGPYDVYGNFLQASPVSFIQEVSSTPFGAKTYDFILVDATASPITINLPIGASQGDRIQVKKVDASVNVVTVSGNGSDIDGEVDYTMTVQYESVSLVFGASQWWVE